LLKNKKAAGTRDSGGIPHLEALLSALAHDKRSNHVFQFNDLQNIHNQLTPFSGTGG